MLGAAATVSSFTLSNGTLTGGGALTVTGAMTWTDGAMFNGNGRVKIASSATMTISGAVDHIISNFDIENAGTLRWIGGNIDGGMTTFMNLAGALFEVRSDGRMFVKRGNGRGIVENAGIFRKLETTGTTELSGTQGFSLIELGIVDIQTGTLAVGDNEGNPQLASNSTGSFTVAANATLQILLGVVNFAAGSASQALAEGCSPGGIANIAGSYNLPTTVVNGGEVNFDNATPGAATTHTLTLSEGSQKGFGRFEITNTLTWTGGRFGATGANFSSTGVTRVGVGATLTISGDVNHFIGGGPYTLENAGTSSGWRETSGAQRRINNLAGGIFDARSTGQMFVNGGHGDAIVNNAGTFLKNTPGTTTIGSVRVRSEQFRYCGGPAGTSALNSTLSGEFTRQRAKQS